LKHPGPFLGLLMAVLAFPVAVHAAPRASALGPQAVVAEASGGFVGTLALSPENGPAGTPVSVRGGGFLPGDTLDLVWRTVDGHWKVSDGSYNGRDFAPVGYRIASVTTDAVGSFAVSFTAPEDFGFEHDVVVQKGTRLLTQTAFNLDIAMTLSPASGPIGTPITVTVHGIGWRDLENSWMLVYDNGFTGWVSSVSTGGTAQFTIPATGATGTHVLRLVHGAFTFPYLNPEQNPQPDRARPRAEFTLTPGDAVLPPAPEAEVQASIRGLPAPGALKVTPAFSGIGKPVEVVAGALQPGKTYQLNWDTVTGNRVALNGWETRSSVVAQAMADANGRAAFGFTVPDDLGGAHAVWIDDGGKRREGSFWVTPTALPLDVAAGPAGTDFTIHLKGVGWSETANIYNMTYDNAYLGYACGFNSQGDVTIHLTASGDPGWHYVDLYPGIYKGAETRPDNFRIPQLTAPEDHPGEDLPVLHFAFEVTPPKTDP
jgi:hypothetical protein